MFAIEIETKEINKGEVIITNYIKEAIEIKYGDENVIIKLPNGKDEIYPINNISNFQCMFDTNGTIYANLKRKADHDAWVNRY